MQRVLRGVLRYRETLKTDLLKEFKEVKDNPKPTMLMFTCMDSRMLPTRFLQSHVGDVFVVRNAGNLIPKAGHYGMAGGDVSVSTEPAAMDLAVKRGGIRHILVCGHSDCKAINTLYNVHQCPKNFDQQSPMDHWVRANGYLSVQKLHANQTNPGTPLKFECQVNPKLSFEAVIDPLNKLNVEDKLSQINCLQQMINVSSHEVLRKYFVENKLFLHAMWFDIYDGEVYLFSKEKKSFLQINDKTAPALIDEFYDPEFDNEENERLAVVGVE